MRIEQGFDGVLDAPVQVHGVVIGTAAELPAGCVPCHPMGKRAVVVSLYEQPYMPRYPVFVWRGLDMVCHRHPCSNMYA